MARSRFQGSLSDVAFPSSPQRSPMTSLEELSPDIRRVGASIDYDPLAFQGRLDDTRILEVEIGDLPDRLHPFRLQGRQSPCLGDVGGSIEECGHQPSPVLSDGSAVIEMQLFRDERSTPGVLQ